VAKLAAIHNEILHMAAGLEAQRRDLMAAGVEKLFEEQASSVGARPVLSL
jgi:hypothetical protein